MAEKSDKAKDNISIFKKECRNYIYYENRLRALNERIGLLDMRMQGVYSPVLDKIGQTPTRHEMNYELIIYQKDNLKREADYYEKKMQWIRDTIDAIPSPAYRSLIWLTYIEKENLQEIADDFEVSRQHIFMIRKKFLKMVLTDERMQQLKDIDDAYEQYEEEDERVA